jgi:hypothetical protein
MTRIIFFKPLFNYVSVFVYVQMVLETVFLDSKKSNICKITSLRGFVTIIILKDLKIISLLSA